MRLSALRFDVVSFLKANMTPQELIKEIELQRDIMTAVATGKSNIQDVNDEYKERRERIREELTYRGIADPNVFSDLWGWFSKWKESLSTYQSRRKYIGELFDPLLEEIRKYKPFTDYEQVLANIDAIDNLVIIPNDYFHDSGYSAFTEEVYFPKVKLLQAHLQRLGFTDLISEMYNIELIEGRLIRIQETLRGLVFPETRTRVQALLLGNPPVEPQMPEREGVLPHSLVANTRGYIEKIVYQINGCYEKGWFDACAVMTRRLIETLIIEAFEHCNISANIKGPTGDYYFLRDLISRTLTESTWNLGRNTRNALPRLKDIGDQSAHSRRFIAQRADIEKIIPDLRVVVQELTFIAGLK